MIPIPEAPDKLLKTSPSTRIRTCAEKSGERRDGIFDIVLGDRSPQRVDVPHRALKVREGRCLFVGLVCHLVSVVAQC